ncbi:MAG: hypothetical protein JO353_05220 [Phycisphaerae bacterium]|nr:hypothetical protein [Phycisphaerae bacterium]
MGTAAHLGKSSIAVVVTTIGRGDFLADYFTGASAEHVLDRTRFIVIPDRKSPPELFDRCAEFTTRGMHIICPTLNEQDAYLAKLNLSGFIPYDSDNRRNIGYLMALEGGSETIISIDDDNYCRRGESFFADHSVVSAGPITAPCVNSSDGWFTICQLMDVQPRMVYPRGFPYARRHATPEITQKAETGRVKLNAGLWLGEPDLDAMTWLVSPVRSTRMNTDSILLGDNAWTPINTQNTALHRDLIVSYYFAKMGYPLGNLGAIDRYGDILSGYLCQATVRHMGDRIRVGTPLVDHRRNSHNYLRDATYEMGCVWLMEDLTAWLKDVKFSGSNYAQSYLSLAAALDEAAERFTGFIWNEAARGYIHSLAYCMRTWTAACSRWL